MNYRHGLRYSKLYPVWNVMNQRCSNPNNKRYKDYGARGITVCDEWKNSFQAFYDWAITNGYDENAKRGKYTIDRINTNGNYEPENCRIVNNKIQANNKRNNIIIEYRGIKKTLHQWCEYLDLNYKKTYQRLFRDNWNVERAFTQR